MSELPDWLPALIRFEDYHGNWQRYEDAVYSKFYSDFIASILIFQGLPVKITKNLIKGKERGFWHLIQEGRVEEQRTPDLRRCERIAWVRAAIEHFNEPDVIKWSKQIEGKTRQLLWVEDAEFLVVLEKRPNAWFLWTAYCVTEEYKKRKLRKEYEQAIK